MNPSTPLKTRSTQNTCRQMSKPLMERRRRARINSYLGDLRTLLLQSHTGKLSQRCLLLHCALKSWCRSKMEKADVLELAVRHLKALTQASGPTAQDSSMCSFSAGYMDCVREVNRFLSSCNGIPGTVRVALLCRLSERTAALAHAGGPGQHHQFQCWDPLVYGVPVCPSAVVPVLHASSQPCLPSDFCEQPSSLPTGDSAFQFLQQSHSLTLLNPGEVPQAAPNVHTWANDGASEKKTHDQSESMPVWRPWRHNSRSTLCL